jgi:hypothetical protein
MCNVVSKCMILESLTTAVTKKERRITENCTLMIIVSHDLTLPSIVFMFYYCAAV